MHQYWLILRVQAPIITDVDDCGSAGKSWRAANIAPVTPGKLNLPRFGHACSYVPSLSGVGITDDTIGSLHEAELIVGLKDARTDLSRPTRLRARRCRLYAMQRR